MADPRDSEVLELTDDALVAGESGMLTVEDSNEASPAKPAKATVAKAAAKPAPLKAKRADASDRQATQRPQQQPAQQAGEEDEAEGHASFADWFRHHLNESSGFAVSMAVHMVLLIILVLLTLPAVLDIKPNLTAAVSDTVDELAEIPKIEPFEEPVEEIDPTEIIEQPDTPTITEEINHSPFNDATEAAAQLVTLSPMGLTAAPEMAMNPANGFSGSGVTGRGQASRSQLVRIHGGTPGSEDAVAMALAWLAAHQNPDGTWHLDFTGNECQGRCKNPGEIRDSLVSATSLALLPFLGAGQTHKEGKYKEQVGKGLDALVRLGKNTPNGVSWMDGGTMYAHGLASIVLCEAYAMTDDYRLMQPAQAAVNFIVYAQDPAQGGWRYAPRKGGDTSVVGWQVMALKSGAMGQLLVPKATVDNAGKFLDACSVDYGEGYSYVPEQKGYKASTSAVGLLCRMYMGWKRDEPSIVAGTNRLSQVGPSKSDYYYNYYGNQVVFQHTNGQGPMWRKWNEELRDFLVATQDKEGHQKGSWFVAGGHGNRGGRLYCTALAAMTLEVYYRHMPIYQEASVEMEFPE